MVGFAHEPTDAGSACVAVIVSEEDPSVNVHRYRDLGAPVLFAIHKESIQWWAQGAGRPRLLDCLKPAQLEAFFAAHRVQLAPERLYRAKTRGRFETGYQLDFVDVGLMPLIEAEIGRKLRDLVEQALEQARAHLAPGEVTGSFPSWLLQTVFWLLAAKILHDKRVPGFKAQDLTAIDQVLAAVAKHYGAQSHNQLPVPKDRRRALLSAAGVLAQFAPLAHVTPEALGAVYESTLVSKQTRSELGIHSTPSFLARYVVWRLAAWIEEIPVEDRYVFEPTCGQGTFLVAAMRVLRDLLPGNLTREKRKVYLRNRLHGVDIDPFAIELARLSLTLADVPNPDGWDLRRGDIFAQSSMNTSVQNATIFLANPPFENFKALERKNLAKLGVEVQLGSKASEVLRRTLPYLRPGAVFGVVVPQGLLHSQNSSDIRSLLVENFEIAEIVLLPDNVFTFSDAESALILGRRLPRTANVYGTVRYFRVREPEVEQFRTSYKVSAERQVPQARLISATDHRFDLPDLEEVWEAFRDSPRMSDVALVGKGLEYKSALPAGTTKFAKKRFAGAQRGYVRFSRKLQLHDQPEELWLNLNSEIIRRPGSGVALGQRQLLLNYARVSRGPWRLKALLDEVGHAVTSRFLTVRPRAQEIPLLYYWGLLNSPLANAYVYTHSTKMDNLKKFVASLPVPRASLSETFRVANAAELYLKAVTEVSDTLFSPAPPRSSADALLLALDAEVLRLYDLPPRLERQVLDLFSGWNRPGVPFAFARYFPVDFEPWIPLNVYLSENFIRSTTSELLRHKEPVPRAAKDALRAAVEAFKE